jgi:hypothetical protein
MSKTPAAVGAEDRAALVTRAKGGMATYVQGSNGDAVYTNARAMMGRVEAGYFLMIPKTIDDLAKGAVAMDVDLKAFGSNDGVGAFLGPSGKAYAGRVPFFNYSLVERTEDQLTFDATVMAAMNYNSLMSAGMAQIDAFFAASLRTRWAMTGGLKALQADMSTTDVEHVVVGETDVKYANLATATTWDELDAVSTAYINDFLIFAEANSTATKWVMFNSEAIWAAVEFVFRTRSHHFKTGRNDAKAYEDTYKKYLTASFEGASTWPSGLDYFAIFHTAIHPFKIRSLAVVTAHYLAHGKISESSKLRLHSAPCGHAVITTAVAALATMQGEVWWNAFERSFHATIVKVRAYADQINADRYSYHQAAGLYGVTPKTTVIDPDGDKVVSINDAKVQVKFICAACQGLIQALNEAVNNKAISGFALSNSKALEKAASDAPLLTMRIATMIYKSLTMAEDAETLSDLIQSSLPEHAAAIMSARVE